METPAPAPAAAAAADPGRLRKHPVRLLLALIGIAVFAILFSSIGWRSIAANVSRMGPWFPLLIGIYGLAYVAFALGWRAVFDPVPPAAAFPRLFGMYLCGAAANTLSPGGVAGEPLKAHLARDSVGGPAALASVTIYKHAELFAQCLFVIAGVGVALARFPIPPGVRAAALATAGGLVGLLAFMTWAVRRGAYASILRRLSRSRVISRWGAAARRLERARVGAEDADARLAGFYRAHPGRFAWSVAWCLAGTGGALVETWIVLRLLAPGTGWAEALAIEGLAMTLNNLFVFLPAKIGGAEGVRVGLFVILGLPAAQGAASSLVRRARELAWTIPGLVLLARSKRSAAYNPIPCGPAETDLPLASAETGR